MTALAMSGAVGAKGRPRPVVEGRSTNLTTTPVGPGFDREVDTGLPTEMVGFDWKGRAEGAVEVRVRRDDGWGPWLRAEGNPDEAPDPGSREHRGRTSAGPLWVGKGIRKVQVRVTEGHLGDLKLHAIRSEEESPALATSQAGAAVAQPAIISRAQWEADESYRTFASGCTGTPDYADSVRYAVVHHTVNSNTYGPSDSPALVRGMYYFHTHTNKWCDIGYNFLVDRYGQVFEGRFGGITRAVVGAHAGGFNSRSTGVALIGQFQDAAVPSAGYAGLRSLLAWKLDLHGVDPTGQVTVTSSGSSKYPAGTVVTLPTVSGHRDVSATVCPGDLLYGRLPQLRSDLRQDIMGPEYRLACDWNGDRVATPAVFRNGQFRLRNRNSGGPADAVFYFGDAGDRPVCGDWNGDGTDTVGVFRDGIWYLRNSNSGGGVDVSFGYGNPGDIPVAGDWNGDAADTPGVVRAGRWYLRNSNTTGVADLSFGYGNPGDIPVAGDWNGDAADTPGVVRAGRWYLRNSNTTGVANLSFGYGNPGDVAVAGDWNGDRVDTPGVVRGSTWYLRNSNTSGVADIGFTY